MANKFLHLGFTAPTFGSTQDIDAALTAVGDDWIRYSGNNWIVWTERTPDKWFSILKPQLGPQGQLLIAELNLDNRAGMMSRWIWEWMDRKKAGESISAAKVVESLGIDPFSPPPAPPLKSIADLFSTPETPRKGGSLSDFFNPKK